MSDLFSGLFADSSQPAKKTFANPNTIYNTVIIILYRQQQLPCILPALHPAFNTRDGIARTGKAVARNGNDREKYEHHLPGLAKFLITLTTQGFAAWAHKRSWVFPAGSSSAFDAAAESNKALFLSHYHSVWKNHWLHLTHSAQFFCSRKPFQEKPSPDDIFPIRFSPVPLKVRVKVFQEQDVLCVKAVATVKDVEITISAEHCWQHLWYLHDDTAYLPESPMTFYLLGEVFEKGILQIPAPMREQFLTVNLPELEDNFTVEMDAALQAPAVVPETAIPCLVLSEMDPDLLVLKPVFRYNNTEVEYHETETVAEYFENGQVIRLQRNKEAEQTFREMVRALHPLFAAQRQHFFYLSVKEAVKENWFFTLAKTLQEKGIALYGQAGLKKLKYNTNLPAIRIHSSSGISWFDLDIYLLYGDQRASLQQLRQAILNRQDYVLLDDGTWGLLPEAWLERLRTLFAVGSIEKTGLQLSKQHYTLLDAEQTIEKDAALAEELAQKKRQLQQIENTGVFPLPKKLKASLRPYQMAGYQWLRQLHSLGWGGCLADDMGLGKTLQTLAFLQSIVEQDKAARLLIVCPTSLLYNWVAEIEKFIPAARYALHHGNNRVPPDEKANLLITSYGTLRNDIELFSKIVFDVAVLDESQVIKNADSQMARVVQMLAAKCCFVLSGTPVQNNTMDLYAQFNFSNPGLLGTKAAYKENFANPIDKYGDAGAAQQLKKILYPFLLRRTKNQVAKDLPDKTETVIYCEMDAYQRSIYDTVKEEYRDRMLTGIAENGMSSSLFLLLEGLNKLRLICDCPSLVAAEEGKRFHHASAKIEELLREITESSHGQKVLVFSQFTGMLALAKDALEKEGVRCLYLDGRTPTAQRARLVQQFQEDAAEQVFLISLKAGGVGLNLTAASYVYLLDPWWNPAAEDQAIDRTHRIGQTQKVFAYKMICRNTVEEKIMQLQQKKKHLAKELISEEAGFVKKLTKADVQFLLD